GSPSRFLAESTVTYSPRWPCTAQPCAPVPGLLATGHRRRESSLPARAARARLQLPAKQSGGTAICAAESSWILLLFRHRRRLLISARHTHHDCIDQSLRPVVAPLYFCYDAIDRTRILQCQTPS